MPSSTSPTPRRLQHKWTADHSRAARRDTKSTMNVPWRCSSRKVREIYLEHATRCVIYIPRITVNIWLNTVTTFMNCVIPRKLYPVNIHQIKSCPEKSPWWYQTITNRVAMESSLVLECMLLSLYLSCVILSPSSSKERCVTLLYSKMIYTEVWIKRQPICRLIFKHIFVKGNGFFCGNVAVRKNRVENVSTVVQVIAWHLSGNNHKINRFWHSSLAHI